MVRCPVHALGAALLGLALLGQSKPAAAPEDVIFDELLRLMNTPVTVASNVMSNRSKQPVSLTTVTRQQIQMSGVRTLNEVLSVYVPGFFQVEDQDDNIAGFRGIASDNNSKVMFLLNGHVLNAEWFWGPPDALLNGIDLDYIERVDVIRGPGSVTLGQGALLGVVNVVTRAGAFDGHAATLGGGPDKGRMTVYDSGSLGDKLKTYVHLSVINYDGQAIRAEGNATRDWEGVRGGKLFAAGNRNHRANATMGIATVEYGPFGLDFLHADQQRDAYNFRRDRSQYTQVLDAVNAKYTFTLAEDQTLEAKLGLAQDDYQLHSNLGYTLGGTREFRQAGTLTYKGKFGPLSLAFGAEAKRFLMGRRNAQSANYIVNNVDPILLNHPNDNYKWVYPKDINVQSLFGEAFYTFKNGVDAFAAFRYDRHPFWGSNLTPRLGLLYGLKDQWNFRLSYQEGFRGAPGVHYAGGFQGDGLLREENFGQVAAATGGAWPNLDKVAPEKSRGVELQAIWTPYRAWKVDAVAYRNKVEHIIGFAAFGSWLFTPVPDTIGSDQKGNWDGYWYYQNTKGSFTTQGLEVSVHWLHPVVHATFSHALTQVVQADASTHGSLYITPQAQGDHFLSYPEGISRLNLLLFPSNWLNGSVNVLSWGRWYTSGPSGAGQTVVNGAVKAKVGGHLSLTCSVTNLFNSTRLYPFTEGPVGTATDQRPGSPSLLERTWWLKAGWLF